MMRKLLIFLFANTISAAALAATTQQYCGDVEGTWTVSVTGWVLKNLTQVAGSPDQINGTVLLNCDGINDNMTKSAVPGGCNLR